MRKSIIYLLSIAALFCTASCTEEFLDAPIPTPEGEGMLTLSFAGQDNTAVDLTRAVHDQEAEQKLNNLRIYIFDQAGSLIGYKKLESQPGQPLATPEGTIKVKTRAGEAYIYAIANMNTAQYRVNSEDFALLDVSPDQVSSSTLTRDKFLQIRFNKQKEALLPLDNAFLMSGYANNGRPVTLELASGANDRIIISNPTDRDSRLVKLYRLVARNKFTVKVANPRNQYFSLEQIELRNVALDGTLIPNADSRPTVVEQLPAEEVVTNNFVEFYLPENLQMAGEDKIFNTWEDREKDIYDPTFTQRTFTNAPENSSYIILKGKYMETNTKSANVAYNIHLGDFGNGRGTDTGKLKNYKVERNSSYNYTITINGVHDIEVEAKREEGADHPYAEGGVISTERGHIYRLDAHYESRIMMFRKAAMENLKKEKFKGYIAHVNTPMGKSKYICVEYDPSENIGYLYDVFDLSSNEKIKLCAIKEDGLYTATAPHNRLTEEQIAQLVGSTDYRWVKFRRNTSENRVNNSRWRGSDMTKNICRYPGDQYFMTSSDNMDTNLTGDKEPLIDIFTLLYQLALHAEDTGNTFWNSTNDNQASVNYSCFIDENYYEKEEWDKFTNQPDRFMHIASRIERSEDQHSTFINVLYSLSQRSIKTFYNPANSGTIKAYGIETVSEEVHPLSGQESDIIRFGKDQYQDNAGGDNFRPSNQDNWKGHECALNALRGEDWTYRRLIKGGQQDMYNTVYRACLSRNRDLNGNGIVDDNEIRWYLGTLGQYNGIWLTEDILPAETRLFDINLMPDFNNISDQELSVYHYYTASANKEIFWAEEGASTGALGHSYAHASMVRAFRTLEPRGKGLADPDPYYTDIKEGTGTNYTITVDLSRIDPRALRPNVTDATLGMHYERDEQNQLPARFMISPKIKGPFTVDDILLNPIDQAAENGWRTPNQRELSIMGIFGEILEMNGKNVYARTRFNGSRYGQNGGQTGYKPTSYGFFRTEGGDISVGITAQGYVLCVKDVE